MPLRLLDRERDLSLRAEFSLCRFSNLATIPEESSLLLCFVVESTRFFWIEAGWLFWRGRCWDVFLYLENLRSLDYAIWAFS